MTVFLLTPLAIENAVLKREARNPSKRRIGAGGIKSWLEFLIEA
jgi:hypothetical protein